MSSRNTSSFTLLETLVAIGVLAALAVTIIMIINPGEFLKEARDSTRLSDLRNVYTALKLYEIDRTGFMGTSSIVYVSLPDSTTTCANLGLPALPDGWTYNCVTQTNLRKIDGNGWIPVNFASITYNSPIAKLPTDPINTTTTGNYYTYVTGGSWEMSANMESSQNKGVDKIAGQDGGRSFSSYEMGSNLNLTPIQVLEGSGRDANLIGYWTFDTGQGITAYDSSGRGNNGTITNAAWQTESSCKVNKCLFFDGSGDYVARSASFINPNAGSVSIWINPSVLESTTARYYFFHYYNGNRLYLRSELGGTGDGIVGVGNNTASFPAGTIEIGKWQHFTVVYNNGAARVYKNGELIKSFDYTGPIDFSSTFYVSQPGSASAYGFIDDVRIYNRALSAAEIQAIYNSTR